MAALLFLLIGLASVPATAHADLVLATAGAPVAPVDAEKAHQDPFVPLSASQRREIVREFKALVSMGMQRSSANHWVGRDISDCVGRSSSGEAFCRKCEVQMGQSHADYYFYPGSESACRLRDVEVVIESGDEALLRDLKPEAKTYTGYAGQFFLDEDDASGQSTLRFVWKRR